MKTKKYTLPGLCLSIAAFIGGCDFLFKERSELGFDRSSLNFPAINYQVKIAIEGDASVESIVRNNAQLIRLQEKPPISTNALRYRAREDKERIRQALQAQGFLDAAVGFEIDHRIKEKMVTLRVKTGQPYKVADFELEVIDQDEKFIFTKDKLSRVVNLNMGQTVDYTKAYEAALRLKRFLQNHGYPFVVVSDPEAVIDRYKKELIYQFHIELKGFKVFDATVVKGQKEISEAFIRNRLAWQEGGLFDERLVEKTKRKLIDTELFSGVYLKPVQMDGKVPMELELTEGPPRLISAGVKYSLTDGYGARVHWEHKNFFGGAERLELTGQLSERDSFAQLDYTIPDVLFPNNNFLAKAKAKYDITKAYKGTTYHAVGKLKHQYNDHWSYYYGLDYEISRLTRDGEKFNRKFVGFPVGTFLDTSNDPINPYKGGKLDFEVTPYYGSFEHDRKMMRVKGRASYYLRLIKKDVLVLAFWMRGGMIYFAKGSEIPLNRRFYAGGAGSVRGYGYQMIGPIDRHRKPEGGRSLVDFGLEPRYRLTEKIGVAAFFEGGSVTKSDSPSLNSAHFLYGVGLGLRYYTEIGPFRLDVAIPTKRRTVKGRKIDAPFQIYLSIGQAF
jgi:translocation and assembly module TamA